eukprot:13694504-Alexandrium_andersonii.AAC.1
MPLAAGVPLAKAPPVPAKAPPAALLAADSPVPDARPSLAEPLASAPTNAPPSRAASAPSG